MSLKNALLVSEYDRYIAGIDLLVGSISKVVHAHVEHNHLVWLFIKLHAVGRCKVDVVKRIEFFELMRLRSVSLLVVD